MTKMGLPNGRCARLLVGGVEARDIKSLAYAVLGDARDADKVVRRETDGVRHHTRHVTTQELRELCETLLAMIPATSQPLVAQVPVVVDERPCSG